MCFKRAMLAANPSAIRRAHRGLPPSAFPARPLSKENLPCATGSPHQNHTAATRPASKPTTSRPSSSPADQAHFSGFVRLLASRDERQRAILVQHALKQAENVCIAGQPSLDEGMRRASSADNLRRRPPVGWHPQSTNGARLLSRRHEAALAQREAAAVAMVVQDCWHSSLPPGQQRVKEQGQQALVRRHKEHTRVSDAATVIQACWHGRQHRRVVRFLRARRARLCRLDWLDHLEWMRCLLNAKSAASHIQAAWRVTRVCRTLQSSNARVRLLGFARTLPPASRSTKEVKPQRAVLQWAAQLSEIRPYEIDS